VLRAGRATDLGLSVSTVAVLAILMIFLFPLLSRPEEPAGARRPLAVAPQAAAAPAPAKPVLNRVALQPLAAPPEAASHRGSLVETSLGLTLILGAALAAMALGSRGRTS
jgi:hypothetical protein